jgi:hypothetical protein
MYQSGQSCCSPGPAFSDMKSFICLFEQKSRASDRIDGSDYPLSQDLACRVACRPVTFSHAHSIDGGVTIDCLMLCRAGLIVASINQRPWAHVVSRNPRGREHMTMGRQEVGGKIKSEQARVPGPKGSA